MIHENFLKRILLRDRLSGLNRKNLITRRNGTCQEETEQDREARALEQVAEWAKVKAGRVEAKAVVQVKAVEA